MNLHFPHFILFLLLATTATAFNGFFGNNPLKLLGKCISDHECKPTEFCDHTGINPIGSCREGHKNADSCTFDRHCRSKVCSGFTCRGKRPVRDGACAKDQHDECLAEQYCSRAAQYRCRDRKCEGACLHGYHCLSGQCSLVRCKKPQDAHLAANFCRG